MEDSNSIAKPLVAKVIDAVEEEKCGDNQMFQHLFFPVRWVADNHDEQVLAGLPYNQKQMFWISFGQIWCSKFKDESLKQQILTGYHSPGEFRVLGSLQNNVDFAQDFSCPLGSPMNPEKKCSVW